jgi:single-stranded DNA-binding protein
VVNGIEARVQGRVSVEPRLRFYADGNAVLNFAIVVHDENRRDDQAAETAWINANASRGIDPQSLQAELVVGREVYITGRLSLHRWTETTSGQDRSGLTIKAWTVTPVGFVHPPRQSDPKPSLVVGHDDSDDDHDSDDRLPW